MHNRYHQQQIGNNKRSMGSSREEVGKEAFPSEDTPLLHKATANDRRKMKGTTKKTIIRIIAGVFVLLALTGAVLLLKSSSSESMLKNPYTQDISPTWLRVPRNGYTSSNSKDYNQTVRVAFVGNSMFYFNDFPRYFEEISNGNTSDITVSRSSSRPKVKQNSCLHGGASLPSILIEGNAMYPEFKTDPAILGQDEEGNTIYDYGACTVPQLLVGYDERIHDPGYAQPSNQEEDTHKSYNPCREDPAYLNYAMEMYGGDVNHSSSTQTKRWDFIVLNDNTRNPSRAKTRALALQTLERFYVPWFLESGATPVFLWTQAYSNEAKVNLTGGLEDVANFTSLTRVGYEAYVDLLNLYLPESQRPRIAPVGLAYLTVYEEDYELWKTLFHSDHLHASPSGTFLQGCIIYYTLFGEMPDRNWIIRPDEDIPALWRRARMMQHAWEPPNPFPTRETTEYLYSVAERIMKKGYIPKSFINYQNGEVADVD